MKRNLPWLLLLGAHLATFTAGAAGPPRPIYYDEGPIVDGKPSKFVLEGRTWTDPNHLTFSFRNYTSDMTQLQIETAVSKRSGPVVSGLPESGVR